MVYGFRCVAVLEVGYLLWLFVSFGVCYVLGLCGFDWFVVWFVQMALGGWFVAYVFVCLVSWLLVGLFVCLFGFIVLLD